MRTPTFSDETITAGLRAAAADLGEPLAVGAYDAWRTSREAASSTLVIRRFGSWIAACTAAGVATNKTRSTSRRWSDDDVLAIVARYLAEDPGSGSYAGYVAWARAQESVPSGPTLRQREPKWNELKARSLAAHPLPVEGAGA
ncbi:homing endonuclease associated repeat-containing protein [Nocardioides jejuensis]|uniref:Uncharacterized protein n=1 Tax=Nocardioides jejuensis TaxID=2502782 RepID=A0A4R1BWP5_9ACTN|nr:hypothetical protein [Nocardioides jejuensis]TCJ22188.1 hypothetical protein EPD65_13515 [Nocardioides jejuensis]